MKHSLKITITLLLMFLLAQFIGLSVMTSYYNYFGRGAEERIKTSELVQPEVSVVRETVPPQIELKKPVDILRIVMVIVISILIATFLFFLLSRVKITVLLRAWFAFVVFVCLSLAFALLLYPYMSTSTFSVLGKKMALAEVIAVPLAAVFTFLKIFKRDILAHNFTELFIYPGLAVIFLPLLNVIAAAILLIAISIYDMIAVWKTKYMIKLAKFQINHLKIFTGFFLPYVAPKDRVRIEKMRALAKREAEKAKRTGKKPRKKEKKVKIKVQIAALGGGDVAFPLIFVGTILFQFGLAAATVTILSTALALLLLLTFGEKGKFYPAMPFLSAGCFLGLILTLLFL
ncbi:MAG: hypothetical protein K6T16_01085 [Candidatus Pacearchaeota archaeon]|nr:hypothetical protein [Candidatus Pacearchaeota archaeon]